MDSEIVMPEGMSASLVGVNIISLAIPVFCLGLSPCFDPPLSLRGWLIETLILISMFRYVCMAFWYDSLNPRRWFDERNCYRVKCLSNDEARMLHDILGHVDLETRSTCHRLMHDAVKLWCKENIKRSALVWDNYVHFHTKSDAALFVMYRPMLVSTLQQEYDW